MVPTAKKGNNPEKWDKFLTALDEKLQLGLLKYLKNISSYHFEENILYIEPGSEVDRLYLTKDAVLQQLQLLAQDIVKVDGVKINLPED